MGAVSEAYLDPNNVFPVRGAGAAEVKPELSKIDALVARGFDVDIAAVDFGVHEDDPAAGTGKVWPGSTTEIRLLVIC